MKILILLCSSFLLAQEKPFELDPSTKQDLKTIKEIHQSKKAQKLAQLLDLSADQTNKLRAVKAEVERIKDEAEPAFSDLERKIAEKAAQLRKVLESGNNDEALVHDLRNLRKELGTWRKKLKLNLQLAAIDLEGFLNQNQIQNLREMGGEKAKKHRQKPHQGKKALARTLLSDAFIEQLAD